MSPTHMNLEEISVIWPVSESPRLLDELAHWSGGRVVEEINPDTGQIEFGVNFPGKDEVLRASLGEYVIKKANGELMKWTQGQYALYMSIKLPPISEQDI